MKLRREVAAARKDEHFELRQSRGLLVDRSFEHADMGCTNSGHLEFPAGRASKLGA